VCTQLIKVCAAISLRAGSLSAAGPCISPVANGRPGRRVDYKKPQPHTPSSAKVKWATFLQSGALIDLVRCESELRPFKTAEEQPSHATLPACIQIDKKNRSSGTERPQGMMKLLFQCPCCSCFCFVKASKGGQNKATASNKQGIIRKLQGDWRKPWRCSLVWFTFFTGQLIDSVLISCCYRLICSDPHTTVIVCVVSAQLNACMYFHVWKAVQFSQWMQQFNLLLNWFPTSLSVFLVLPCILHCFLYFC
jgi:hypothetical protein